MTIPPPPKKSNIWKTLAIALLVVVIILGAIVGILSTNLLSSNQGTGTNNQVIVSGTVSGATDNVIDSVSSSNQNLTASAPIINGRYTVSLVNGQSYQAVTPSGDPSHYPPNASEYYSATATFYVPSGVSTFTQNLV